MPKALIESMKRGYSNSGLSEEEINHRVYGHLAKRGLLEDRRSADKSRTEERSRARARKFLSRTAGEK